MSSRGGDALAFESSATADPNIDDGLLTADVVATSALPSRPHVEGLSAPVGVEPAAVLAGAGEVVPGSALLRLPVEREDPAVPSRRVARRRFLIITAATVLADLFAVTLGYVIAKELRVDQWWLGTGILDHFDEGTFATIPAWLAIFAIYGLYDRRRLTAASEELRRIINAVSISVVGVVVLAFTLRLQVSRGWIVAIWLSCLGSVGITRLVVRRVVHRLNARRITGTRTIVVGVNQEGRTLARTLERQRWMGYGVVGFVDAGDSGVETVDGHPVLGGMRDLGEAVRRTDAGMVIVAGTAVDSEGLTYVDRALSTLDVKVRVSPGLPHIAASRVTVAPVDGLALLSLRRNQFTRRQAMMKRALDLVAAGTLILLTSPVLIAVALLVKLTSAGPVLFRQVRVGEGGAHFVIYKFRTMVVDAEARLRELRSHNEADGLLFKMRDDPRVTRVGRTLRRFAIDELPQLFNVIKGDMSLVGPRPALPEEAARYDDEWMQRLRVKPGVTGLWQVNGRHELAFDDYVRYDLFYVENWSLGLDLYVMARTVPALLSRQGAF